MSRSRYYPHRRNDRAWSAWQMRIVEQANNPRAAIADGLAEHELGPSAMELWDAHARNDGRRRNLRERNHERTIRAIRRLSRVGTYAREFTNGVAAVDWKRLTLPVDYQK